MKNQVHITDSDGSVVTLHGAERHLVGDSGGACINYERATLARPALEKLEALDL
ncbi:MAG: hypothetical protein U0931_35940 [Vulcanimicrobiota bacterium]